MVHLQTDRGECLTISAQGKSKRYKSGIGIWAVVCPSVNLEIGSKITIVEVSVPDFPDVRVKCPICEPLEIEIENPNIIFNEDFRDNPMVTLSG